MTTTTTSPAEADDATAGKRRWPLRPLLDACRCSTVTALAGQLGLGGTAVAIAASDGLSDRQADRWAIKAGLHPVLVWGWAWIDAAATPDAPHDRVALDLRARIEQGELPPGHPLPTVKALAQHCQASTRAVARATALLASDGLVTTPRRGQRPVVAHPSGVGCRICGECGEAIALGTEHYPHRLDCTQPVAGWCDCDHPTHPQCCPTCPASEVGR